MREQDRREIFGQYQYPIEHREDEPCSNIAILFPGQDVQKPGMFDEILKYPAGQEVIRRADAFLGKEFRFKISEIAAKDAHPAVLRQTQYTQPAVFALSIGIHNVNKYHRKKDGYKTLPGYVTGNSMGMITATTLSGASNFEMGLWLAAIRGKIMQEHGDPTPTVMKALINSSEVQRWWLLKKYPDLDLCLINSDAVFVIGGPIESLQKAAEELTKQKVKAIDVNTDRAMHGRYVRPAKPKFSEVLRQVRFKTPIIPIVGTHTGLPIRDVQGIIDELEHGFDNTFDNTKALKFFDAERIHVISEVNEKGIFTKAMERSLGAVATHKVEAAALGLVIVVGVGVYEVITRHHPNNK